jgi:hypothetical protein
VSYAGRINRLFEKAQKLNSVVTMEFVESLEGLTEEMLGDPTVIYLYLEI